MPNSVTFCNTNKFDAELENESMTVALNLHQCAPRLKTEEDSVICAWTKSAIKRKTINMNPSQMTGNIPPSEQYRVLKLVRREPVKIVVSANAGNTVDFLNASGSLRQVNDGEIRPLARQSTAALLAAIASGDDTAQI